MIVRMRPSLGPMRIPHVCTYVGFGQTWLNQFRMGVRMLIRDWNHIRISRYHLGRTILDYWGVLVMELFGRSIKWFSIALVVPRECTYGNRLGVSWLISHGCTYEILGSWDPYKHGTFLMTSFLVSLILLTWAVYFAWMYVWGANLRLRNPHF